MSDLIPPHIDADRAEGQEQQERLAQAQKRVSEFLAVWGPVCLHTPHRFITPTTDDLFTNIPSGEAGREHIERFLTIWTENILTLARRIVDEGVAECFGGSPQETERTLEAIARGIVDGLFVYAIKRDQAGVIRNLKAIHERGDPLYAEVRRQLGACRDHTVARLNRKLGLPVRGSLDLTKSGCSERPEAGKEGSPSGTSSSEEREPLPAFLSGPPLATIGPLPPALLAAFNGAVYLARTANSIRRLLGMRGTVYSQETARSVIAMVDQIRAVRNACRAAIEAVTNELNAVRDGPARFGEIVKPNAHLAASALARAVLREIWSVADPLAYAQCFLDPTARMHSSLISDRFETICEHFRDRSFPNGNEIIAEVQIEAAKAAHQRHVKETDERATQSAKLLWDRNPIEAFERLRDRVCVGVQHVVAIHEQAANAPPSASLADIGRELHESLDLAHCEAQAIWYDTSIRRFLERTEGPVYLDHLDERAIGRVSGSCYHDLAMGIVSFTVLWINKRLPAREFRAELRFRTSAGEDVGQHLLSLLSNIRCECVRGIAQWREESRLNDARSQKVRPDPAANTPPMEWMKLPESIWPQLPPEVIAQVQSKEPLIITLGRLHSLLALGGNLVPATLARYRELPAIRIYAAKLGFCRPGEFTAPTVMTIADQLCVERGIDQRSAFSLTLDAVAAFLASKASGGGAGETPAGAGYSPSKKGQIDNTQGGTDDDREPVGKGDSPDPPRREELVQTMEASVRLAYLAYAYAESKEGKPLEDREAYNLLKEEGIPEGAGDRGELAEYKLPAFDTWARYLREARKILNEQKYTRRSGRSTGKSIVNPDQIEQSGTEGK
jgi:hypothetical protein